MLSVLLHSLGLCEALFTERRLHAYKTDPQNSFSRQKLLSPQRPFIKSILNFSLAAIQTQIRNAIYILNTHEM
jgi:hypothetical protein